MNGEKRMAKRKKYYVVGAHYTSTDWTKIIKGTKEKHGPFGKKKAYNIWNSRAWATVDICCFRFRIYEESELPDEWVDL